MNSEQNLIGMIKIVLGSGPFNGMESNEQQVLCLLYYYSLHTTEEVQ